MVKVTNIPKAGRRPKCQPKPFCPISLTSLLKTMEKLIDRHKRNNELHENPLHTQQYAYLVSRIEKSKVDNEITVVCFLGGEDAFDKTSFNAIFQIAQSSLYFV